MNTAATQSYPIEQPLYLSVYEALRDALRARDLLVRNPLPR